jgi:hypothetical protein
MSERLEGIIKPTNTPGVFRIINFDTQGWVRAGELAQIVRDRDLGLDELEARTDDWYGSTEDSVSFEGAAGKEYWMKDWHDDAVEAENDLDTDFPKKNGRPPCIASGLRD